jgi:hypothetical protein
VLAWAQASARLGNAPEGCSFPRFKNPLAVRRGAHC